MVSRGTRPGTNQMDNTTSGVTIGPQKIYAKVLKRKGKRDNLLVAESDVNLGGENISFLGSKMNFSNVRRNALKPSEP